MTKNAMKKSLESAGKLDGHQLHAVRGGFGAGQSSDGSPAPPPHP